MPEFRADWLHPYGIFELELYMHLLGDSGGGYIRRLYYKQLLQFELLPSEAWHLQGELTELHTFFMRFKPLEVLCISCFQSSTFIPRKKKDSMSLTFQTWLSLLHIPANENSKTKTHQKNRKRTTRQVCCLAARLQKSVKPRTQEKCSQRHGLLAPLGGILLCQFSTTACHLRRQGSGTKTVQQRK